MKRPRDRAPRPDRRREQRGAAQIEGRRPVIEALRAGRPVRRILLADGASGPELDEILRLAGSSRVQLDRVPGSDIDERARSNAPQGVIAIVPPFAYSELDDALALARKRGQAPLLVAVDGLTDPHNLGALARSAEAMGAHGLLVPERRTTPVTPVVEKAAAGALAWLPVIQTGGLPGALRELKKAGVWIVSLDDAGRCPVWEIPVATEPMCLVVGAEGRGVSRLVLDLSDVVARIPLLGRIGSLNASVAGGIALFEISRRRRQDESGAL
jgi:23S rRNA (guanosine2251-2'-O)-methyltransferase